MKLKLAWIGKTKEAPIQALTAEYVKRIARYCPIETLEVAGEAALLKQVERASGRVAPLLVLLDPRGRALSSEQLAD
ncbi:MAG TPA: 23S rRNA (pseudouridine(1915)-N(3))-methyltransferase RlmH, partial [Terriglobales bacterium]|nr:23S rRNA (pseudouridine(1915)-N(3))-methyltransferase RlmH [Terriglobales bacterium]